MNKKRRKSENQNKKLPRFQPECEGLCRQDSGRTAGQREQSCSEARDAFAPQGVFSALQVFLKKLQYEKPSVKGLLRYSFQKRELQYPDKWMSVWRFSFFALNKAREEKKPRAKHLQLCQREKHQGSNLKNRPLNNELLRTLSGPTRSMILHQGTFDTLATAVTNTVKSE
ncbi:hypothetical protein AOLI_G00211700 [Acnodon oligacanthus]